MPFPSAPAPLVRLSKTLLRDRAPEPLREALAAFPGNRDSASSEGDALAVLAAFGLAANDALLEAQKRSGREVVATIFELHRKLRPAENRSTETAASPLPALDAFEAWLHSIARESPPWRAVLMKWIDLFSERLTLHRYADAAHRERQARVLFADPLRLAFEIQSPETQQTLEDFATLTLRFWDLLSAERDAQRGWNRIEIESGALGGFFGLADQARPAEDQASCAAAQSLREALEQIDWTPLGGAGIDPRLAPWIAELRARIAQAIDRFLAEKRWPISADRPAPRPFWKRLFGG